MYSFPIERDVDTLPLVNHLQLPESLGDEVSHAKVAIYDEAKSRELASTCTYCQMMLTVCLAWSYVTITDHLELLYMSDKHLQAHRLHTRER